MAPAPWTTPEELAWLQSRVPEYLTKQTERKLWKFWPALKAEWFRQFPEEARMGIQAVTAEGDAVELTPAESTKLTTALVARNAQLENWFRHHSKKTTKVSAAQKQAADSLESLLFKPEPRKRPHRPIELFQKRHPLEVDAALEKAGFYEMNEAHAAEQVEGWADESNEAAQARMKAHRKRRMELRGEVVRDLLSKASVAEKDEIDRLIVEETKEFEKMREGKKKGTSGDDEEDTLNPEDYQRHIDESPEVINKVHEVIKKMTGWYGFTVYGGPNPRMEGELSFKVVCFGKTPAGLDFQAAHGSFDSSITKPFVAFLRRGFTRATRQSRALVRAEEAEAVLPSLDGLFRIADDAAEPTPPPAAPTRRDKTKRVRKKKTTSAPAADTTANASTSTDTTSSSAASPTAVPSAMEDESVPPDTSCDLIDDRVASPPFFPSLDYHLGLEYDDNMQDDINLDSTDDGRAAGAGSTTMWPVGMGPPPSPATANAIALAERPLAVGATYEQPPRPVSAAVIDPALLRTPERPGTGARPAPRPLAPGGGPRPHGRPATWGDRGRERGPLAPPPDTVSVMGFNFPVSPKEAPSRLHGLLNEFREHVAISPARFKERDAPATSPPGATSTPHEDTGIEGISVPPRTSARPGGATSVAAAMAAASALLKTKRSRAGVRTTATVAAMTAAISRATTSNSAFSSPTASATSSARAGPAPTPPTVTPATPLTAPPNANAPPLPALTLGSDPPSSPVPRAPVYIPSRPMANKPKPAPKPKTLAAGKKGKASAAAKGAAVKSRAGVKGRGRAAAKKAGGVASDNDSDSDAAEDAAEDADGRSGAGIDAAADMDGENARGGAASGSANAPPPALIYSTTNNTSRWNQMVEARQEKAKAALRAENKRTFNPDGERPLDILPGPPPEERAARTRKPARNFDGSYVEAPPKKMTRLELQQQREAEQRERDAERERQESLIMPSARKRQAAEAAAKGKKQTPAAAGKKQTAATAGKKQVATKKRAAEEAPAGGASKKRRSGR